MYRDYCDYNKNRVFRVHNAMNDFVYPRSKQHVWCDEYAIYDDDIHLINAGVLMVGGDLAKLEIEEEV